MTEELQQLAKILDLQWEEFDYGKKQTNSYRISGKNIVHELRITGRDFDLEVLLPFKQELYQIWLTDCTIDSLAGLSQIPYLSEIHFDNVIIRHGTKATGPIFDKMPDLDPRLHVYLKNMHLEYPAELVHAKKRLDHLFLTNCTISNFYELNLFPELYDLRLTNTIIQQSEEDIVHQPLPDRHFIRICLDEMNLENLDVFLPISENVSHIELERCTIGSIRTIHRFRKLNLLEIDDETHIRDQEFEESSSTDFYIETCKLGSVLGYEPVPEEPFSFDLKQLGSVAPLIKSLHLQGTVVYSTHCLKYFTHLEELKLEKCTAQLHDFLPVAHQINSLSLDEAKVIGWEYISAFTHLEQIRARTFHELEMIGDLRVLLPVKHRLKTLELFGEPVRNSELIGEFTAVEFLEAYRLDSLEAAKNILMLGALKKLDWSFYLEEKPQETLVLDVSGLKSIRELELSSDFVLVKGLEHLSELERLSLNCDGETERLHQLKKLTYLEIGSGEVSDVNKISQIDSLKTLVLSVNENHHVHSLEQFPNLEKLKLEGGSLNVHIGKLNQLKLFIPDEIDLENATWLRDLPNLEKLNLEYQQLTRIQNLDQLTNLKMLDLSENELESLDGLENLENLEYLNLYENKLSDVRLLNRLPNLKEVNLAGNKLEDDALLEQLDRPEIACFLYRPYIPFSIRIDRGDD